MSMQAAKPNGLLIDLDGVIYNDSQVIPGALDTIRFLQDKNIPFRFLTNTTMKCRQSIQSKLMNLNIIVEKEQIFSAAYAAAEFIRRQKKQRCFLLLTEDAQKDYQGLAADSGDVDYVVVGDLADQYTFQVLNKAFNYLLQGARLIALQKNRFWLSDQGYTLDAGAFVALLEYAANCQAQVIGKPSVQFFEGALHDLHLSAGQVMMIGDDLETDIDGAANLGIRTCLVQTGKFRKEDFDRSIVKPDYILPSIAFLPQSGIL